MTIKLKLGVARLSAAIKKTLTEVAGKPVEHVLLLTNIEDNGRTLHTSTMPPDKTLEALKKAVKQLENNRG